MKNIQTGNEIKINQYGDYTETHGIYTISATAGELGEYSAAILKDGVIYSEAREWPCLDDALQALEDTDKAQEIKWYSPQILGR